MTDAIPALFTDALKLAHATWRPVLRTGLAAVALLLYGLVMEEN